MVVLTMRLLGWDEEAAGRVCLASQDNRKVGRCAAAVDQAGAGNAETRIALGVSDRRVLAPGKAWERRKAM